MLKIKYTIWKKKYCYCIKHVNVNIKIYGGFHKLKTVV